MQKVSYLLKVKKISIVFGCLNFWCLSGQQFSHILDSNFIKTALSEFNTVGAIAPFSEVTTSAITSKLSSHILPRNKKKTIRILELGAGTGTLSKKIVEALQNTETPYQLDLIELLPDYCEILEKKFAHNKKIAIHNVDAQTWKPTYKYDVIISTLPFNALGMPATVVSNILTTIEATGKDHGLYVWVEYAFLPTLLGTCLVGQSKKEHLDKQLILKKFKEKHPTHSQFILWNIPSTHLHVQKLKLN